MSSEAQKKATAKYQAANRRRFVVNVNRKTEADLLAWLESKNNVSGYLKSLASAEMCVNSTLREKGVFGE